MKGDIIMPLFERGYRAAAKTELEREIRKIEEKDRKAQKSKDFEKAATAFESNLTFAERLNLISAEQAANYTERMKKAILEHEQSQRIMQQENLIESVGAGGRRGQYASVEEALADIRTERAAEKSQQEQQSQNSQTSPEKSAETPEHSHA